MCEHIQKLWHRLTMMERCKQEKPSFSQSCDRLMQNILELNGESVVDGQLVDEQYFRQLRNANDSREELD